MVVRALVTQTVTTARSRPAWVDAPRTCLCCTRPLAERPAEDGGLEALTCSPRCHVAAWRARTRLRPLVRLLARLVEGAPPETPIRFAGVIRALWQTERALARAEVQRARLPGRNA